MLQQKKVKLSNYYYDALKASYHFKQKNWDEARQFYRKSGEAFMKYRLYDRVMKRKSAIIWLVPMSWMEPL